MLSLYYEEEGPGCTYCNTNDETFFHFATECPALLHERQDVFLDKSPSDDMEWNIRDIIKFSNLQKIDKLLGMEQEIEEV